MIAAEDLADEAFDSMSGDEGRSRFGKRSASSDHDLDGKAHMKRFLKAAESADTAGMWEAFKGAKEACRRLYEDEVSDRVHEDEEKPTGGSSDDF